MELKELIKALWVMDLSVRGGHGRWGWVGGGGWSRLMLVEVLPGGGGGGGGCWLLLIRCVSRPNGEVAHSRQRQ